jgi:putative membrane protein
MMRGFGGFGGIGHMGAFGWIGMILGGVITVAFIIVVVLLVIFLVRRLGAGSHVTVNSSPPAPNQSAKDIASARYARGEITREEYQQILTDLSH